MTLASAEAVIESGAAGSFSFSYRGPPKDEFFALVSDEQASAQLAWNLKALLVGLACSRCQSRDSYPCKSRPEIRRCRQCRADIRLRAGLPYAGSKVALSVWLRATFLMARSVRAVSAMRLQRELGLTRYATAHRVHKTLSAALRDPALRRAVDAVFGFAAADGVALAR